METADVIALLLHGNQLKRTDRTGWAQRGVIPGENVAAHTYGTAFVTLVLARLVEEPVDLGRALTLAILHDLPEGKTSDIPSPAWRLLPPGTKKKMERAALEEMVKDSAVADDFLASWEELNGNESVEARLVHDADKIDMFVQAMVFEEQTGNRHLAEFWEKPRRFHFAAAQAIYDALRARRTRAT